VSRAMLYRRLPILCLLIATCLLFAPHNSAQQSNGSSSQKQTGTITGHVINSAGEPLAGARVSAYQIQRDARPGSAIADNRGEFKIDGLAPGIYSVSASMPGYINPQSLSLGRESFPYYHPGDSATITLIKGGVITGTVTGADGPLVGLGVFAIRVRDGEGRKVTASLGRERHTDDRGVFRFYGLVPGAYTLCTARPRMGAILPSAYDNDAPTFYPSATRDTAAELEVREGDELTADIRYRGEPGHAISGRIAKANAGGGAYVTEPAVSITDVRNSTELDNIGLSPGANLAFAFAGLPDGDYELAAGQYQPASGERWQSPPLRVSVHGADVTGLVLSLAPPAAIDGRLLVETDPKLECGKREDSLARETMIWARRYEPQSKPGETKIEDRVSLSATNHVTFAIPDAKGSFSLANLPAGAYRIDPRGLADGWYIRSISKGLTDSPAAKAAVAKDGISVKNGEHVNGLTVTITEGAAQLRGRITAAEAQTLPPRPAIYLVPAEPNSAENVLRFYEARADGGAFNLNNVAPGNYWILARSLEETESFMTSKSIRHDAALRAKVQHEAESIRKTITLKPCEQLADFNLPYSPATP